MPLPDFTVTGDLPEGVHQATIDEVRARLGGTTSERKRATTSLDEVWRLARATGYLERLVIWGSYVTTQPAPRDIDLFLVMDAHFDVETLKGDTRTIFSHAAAEARFGASIFWITTATSEALLDALLDGWQTKRNGEHRGIVEVTE